MSVSIENETSENTQQNRRREAAAQNENQTVATQSQDQAVSEQNNEPTIPNSADNDRENKFDLEKSKSKLECISIALALISVISTGLVKVLSLGTHLQFNFDINNYEFKLTNTDFIILFLSAVFCIFAIIFCYETRGLRNLINTKISNCLQGNTQKRKYLLAIGLFLIFIVIILVYLFLGLFILYLLCKLKGISPFLYELQFVFILTFLFVFYLYCFTLIELDKNKLISKVSCIVLFVLIVSGFMYNNYEKAVNQREFEIIVAENYKGQLQEYVVISKGSSYSAYQCSIEEQEAGKVLIIHTDLHRSFPLDDTETKLNIFSKYQLYKYGKPLDPLDEENNSDEYQSNEE